MMMTLDENTYWDWKVISSSYTAEYVNGIERPVHHVFRLRYTAINPSANFNKKCFTIRGNVEVIPAEKNAIVSVIRLN
jgi:hypothetical protein